jgi:N-acetylglucosaminyl-diphospho-decaprenol L-rhamnosyltransferase
MKSDVSIVIITYNSEDQILHCLKSIFAEQQDARTDVIVVDNASTDETVALIQKNFPQVELVLPGANLGFAAGVNLGASHANAEFVLLLNPDTVILNHAVDKVVSFARNHPENGLYGGRTLRPDGTLEPSSCWGRPSLWTTALFAIGLTTLAPTNKWLNPESLGNWQRDTIREVGVITGCFLLCPLAVWKQLGGLDERYFMYGEDVDFALRARRMGYRPIICPDAELIHEVGQSSETPVHKTLLLYRGKASLIRSHWSGISKTLGIFLLISGIGLRAFVAGMFPSKGKVTAGDRWQTLWRERGKWSQGY